MNVGIVGLGKLGMPVAVAMDYRGHNVMGYDVDLSKMRKDKFEAEEEWPFDGRTFQQVLAESSLEFGALEQVVHHADIIFVAVQTPHDPLYEGRTRVPALRKDFDYGWLIEACEAISEEIDRICLRKTVVIISTVLPGTIRREILPIMSPLADVCYNPSFIAMGTVVKDYLEPEFVLFGEHSAHALKVARQFYKSITDAPMYETSVENAEAIKVFYNTFITMKIVFANTVMEVADNIMGLNCDEIMDGLAMGTRRIISPAYLRGGMGDGGGCHPRDNIALSWLAKSTGLSFDFFDMLMRGREKQTAYLADLALGAYDEYKLPIRILGTAFKPGTKIETGSPARLLETILNEDLELDPVETFDPMIDAAAPDGFFETPAVFVIGCKHPQFKDVKFPAGSVVIDPHRYILPQNDITLHSVGVGE